MVEIIPNRLQKTWEIWNVRGVILFSLSLQIILFLGAPMRKRTGNKLFILIIWGSYFLADWTASFTIGLITSSRNSSKIIQKSDLLAFWAQFLLLHLGGPDTIIAFSLEDNELWLRHFLTLIFQVFASFYVFLETLPSNKLWLPTSLLFLAGVIKYSERTRSLYRASWGTFRETMLTEAGPRPGDVKLKEPFFSKKVERLPITRSQTVDAFHSSLLSEKEKLDDFDLVKCGYHFSKIFKGLIVDLISHNDRNESRKFFLGRTAEDALEVLEVELNFIYEVLYTKFFVIHDLIGYLFRSGSSLLVFASLLFFFFVDCKQGLDKFDIRVTYTLLLGALGLEAIALFNLIFSDWTTASLFDESLLHWHIATELCFHGSEVNHNTKAQPNEELSNHGSEVDHEKKAQSVPEEGDRSTSVLFDACKLAKELQKFEEEEKWEVISRVWVEMLSYASNHCRPDAHAQQVSRGGQLINLVWLLMAHFGLGEQFIFTAGYGPFSIYL